VELWVFEVDIEKLVERFEQKYEHEPMSGCWIWIGARIPEGYGHFNLFGRAQGAHRVSYFLYRGSLGAHDVIDHLCRNPSCVNPDHLEVVTHKINLNRGRNFRRERTACPQCGEPYTKMVRRLTLQRGLYAGERICLSCTNARRRERYKAQSMV